MRTSRWFGRAVEISAAFLALGFLLFSTRVNFPGIGDFLRDIAFQIDVVCSNRGTQWMMYACLAVYFVLSIVPTAFIYGVRPIRWSVLLLIFFAISTVQYIAAHHRPGGSKEALILLAGATVGRIAVVYSNRSATRDAAPSFSHLLVGVLLLLLLLASITASASPYVYTYHNFTRWTGPWNNPNVYGLLMGTCFVLSSGFMIEHWHSHFSEVRLAITDWKVKIGKYLILFFWLLVIICTGRGLFHSFSRGAWIATLFSLGYLSKLRFDRRRVHRKEENGKRETKNGTVLCFRLKTKLVPLSVIFISMAAIAFWQFRFTEWKPAKRLFSVVNINDFSWRNRVTAWEGAVQMMADKPWIGYGWGTAESAYEGKYRPQNLDDGAAIQMNDYFMLGISVGVPALACFLVYVGLSLRSPSANVELQTDGQVTRGREFENEVGGEGRREQPNLDWLQATCRAGAIVLLVGFFFDGGLFKLATGSVFWILLELGRVDPGRARQSVRALVEDQKSESQSPVTSSARKPWEVWFRRGAWILGIAAVSESTILLSMPFFRVNNTTLTISRHYLVPPSVVADLNLLATNVDWSSRKLRPLLQHSSLANYNRQLINWKLDGQIYRDYVLSPLIDSQRDGQLAWRRKLWEYFYLPMRKENDPFSAARIVLKFLHQRIATVPQGPVTIDEMWGEKRADERGLQALEVAAFRSVGVPARLDNSGRAELFSEGKWRALPEDTQSSPESARAR
jgi:O-antigen ligase